MKMRVKFNEIESFCARFIQTECTFHPFFGEIVTIRSDEVYDGEYNVIPRVYEQKLETKDKLMLNDVTVEVIPLARTLNVTNGYTVTIG